MAELKRREMEEKFIKLKLERCEKGMPRNHKWEAHWRDMIGKSVSAAARYPYAVGRLALIF